MHLRKAGASGRGGGAAPFPPRVSRARCIRARLLETGVRVSVYNFGAPLLELRTRHAVCASGGKISGSLNTGLNVSSFFSSRHPDLEYRFLSPNSSNLIVFAEQRASGREKPSYLHLCNAREFRDY